MGRRFYSNQNSLTKLKRILDEVCLQFDVQPYDKMLISKSAIAAHDFYYRQYITVVRENSNLIDIVRSRLYEAKNHFVYNRICKYVAEYYSDMYVI